MQNKAFLCFCGNNGWVNVPQVYVLRTSPIMCIPRLICSVMSPCLLSFQPSTFFSFFLLPLGIRHTFSPRDSFCIWEQCITCDVRTGWVSITLGLSGLQAYLMARTLTLPRPPPQLRTYDDDVTFLCV